MFIPRNLFAALTLALVLLMSFTAFAQAPPSADSYITNSQPLANFGSVGFLPVQSETTSYVRMNLAGLPANTTIVKATLRLYVNAVAAPGSFDVYQLDSGWTESGLTLNNAPALGASATGGRPVSVTAASLNQFILIDITPLAQGWMNGSIPNHGVALALTSLYGSFSFDSKESTGTGHQPELEVSFGTASQSSETGIGTSTGPSQDSLTSATADSSSAPGAETPTGVRAFAQGHGTKGYLPIWINQLYLSNSVIFQGINKNLGIGTTTPMATLDVQGNVNASIAYQIGGTSVLTGSGTKGNIFVGAGAGSNNTTGSTNSFFGFGAGQNNTTGSNDVYIANSGPGSGNESGAIRIGDPANQTSAFIAGVTGAATNSGLPVFVDSTGKLGTSGGSVNFSQVVGTLTSPQFSGTYNSSVVLSNTNNVFTGAFTGNGSGLTGVSSGLSWPIVLKSADYTVQSSDFSSATSYGKYLILTGSTAHTFTLPSTAPANGNCVAIGNLASAGIGSNTNVFLTVSANGLSIDGGAASATQPKRNSYLYCSDGTGYWRLSHQLASPSQIGPVLYTQDTGTANVLQTTFVSGLDFGLNTGTAVFLLPRFANTSATPTLNVNGLGAQKIVRFGNHALAPGDLTTTALAVLIYDGQFWQLVNPQTVAGTVTAVTASAPLASTGGATPNLSCPTCVTTQTLIGTTGSIGGVALTAGTCTSGTSSVTGATVGHPVSVSASDGSLPNGSIVLSAAVTSPNTVTVQLCGTASVTPAANTYNVATQ